MLNACTKRYLLKPIIPIIIYYHSTAESTLRMTNSMDIRRSQHYLPYISSLIFDKTCFTTYLMLGIVLVCRRPRQLPTMRVRNFHSKESKLGASPSFSRKLTTRYLLKPIRDPHDPLITRGCPFANVSDQKHNITRDIPPSQSRQVRAQF